MISLYQRISIYIYIYIYIYIKCFPDIIQDFIAYQMIALYSKKGSLIAISAKSNELGALGLPIGSWKLGRGLGRASPLSLLKGPQA